MPHERPKDLQKLFDKRDNLIRAIKFHAEKGDTLTDAQQIEAFSRLNALDNAYEKFTATCESLENHEDFAYSDLVIPNEDIIDIYITKTAKLKSIAKELLDSSIFNSSINPRPVNAPIEVKLPQITIPTFGGDYEEWTAFYDAFVSLVDYNVNLSDVNKMHYLRSSLKGDALKVISRLPVTEANYKVALKALIERFQNKRVIVNKCLNTLINQPAMRRRNANEIRSLIDTTKESIQCIDTLNIMTDDWGPFIIFIVQSKMDTTTRVEWEDYLGGATSIPNSKSLFTFLETQFRILDGSNFNNNNELNVVSHEPVAYNPSQNKNRVGHNTNAKNQPNNFEICSVCKENHWILNCPKFLDWPAVQRKNFAVQNKICIVCLHSHENNQCRSTYRCKKCNGAHSFKLHTEYDDLPQMSTTIATVQSHKKVFATAIIKVQDKFGAQHVLRAFIDMGAGGALISERAAQLLCLPRKRVNIPLTGVDDMSLGKSTNSVQIRVQSIVDSSFKLTIDTLVLRKILPHQKFPHDMAANWKHLNELDLADPYFINPSHIDLLFGVDVYGLIIKEGIRKGLSNEPVAQNSHFGWLVFGGMLENQPLSVQINAISIEQELRRLWENEEISMKPIMTEEHAKCVEHFEKTCKRLPDGSFMVALPFNMNPDDPNFLGESKKTALCRFYQIEKRFKRDPLFKQRYHDEMKGYLERNHMSLCTSNLNEGYFLPHHAVVRESSTTTKQRTVFDASAKSTNGFSLNDRCRNGPTIQPELIVIFILWRVNKVALNGDVEKMYRMVKLRPEDRKFQKILYRFSEDEPIQVYELNTVTFGTKSAPYLAIATTFALADAEKDRFPEAAKRVKKEVYVDDCMSGSHSIESTIKLQQEYDNLFKSGHFLMRKWASNEPKVLEHIPQENRAIKQSFELNMGESIKTLGLVWTPKVDELSFTIDMSAFHPNKSITKRQLLSDASKIFDPCGYLAPITIKSKITMQDVWRSGTDWDSVVPTEIQAAWNLYKNELPLIEKIKIKRWFNTSPNSIVSLHGFCDSSEKAMACVIYIIQHSNNQATSAIVCSKTKVAPIASQTIPRLELNGAVLLAKLMEKTARNLSIAKSSVYLWTDSSIVLTWLQSHASRWLPYVSARVRTIHELFDAKHWQHVRTHENPADIASRGVLPSELINNEMWFHGPKWLLSNESEWPKLKINSPPDDKLEVKQGVFINAIQTQADTIEPKLLLKFNSFYELIRISSLVFRFIFNCRRKETLRYSKDIITRNELNRAEIFWAKYVQEIHFKTEVNSLKVNQNVSEKSLLKNLNPQFNENGLMVVHGRLQYADFSPLRKFPIILPAKSHFTKLAIEKAHFRALHGSIHLTLATLRQEYWVLNGRNLVKKHIHECIRCYRQNPKPLTQLMAPLPHIKTAPSLSFIHTGMDFAGPFEVKVSTRRNATTTKGYICVFVCMVSKAVHLEAVGDLSTQRFIGALRRFVSRRGLCTDLYCDQGSNFKGASNELPLLFLQAKAQATMEIQNLFSKDHIQFHFNPPSAPHWGGQWESFVKLTKHHLNRLGVSVRLTFEDMQTFLAQIEACINSRPLCAITNDIDDLDPITAGHLLTGRALNLIPEPSLLALKDTTLDQFQAIQKGIQMFWKRFYVEYLHHMHPRKKWYKAGSDLNVNDLVVIIDDNLPPAKWLMGRVVELHEGNDGYVRMATVQTKARDDDYGQGGPKKKPPTFQRPIAKLCKLPIGNETPPPPEYQEEGGGCSES